MVKIASLGGIMLRRTIFDVGYAACWRSSRDWLGMILAFAAAVCCMDDHWQVRDC